jgi:hypothetical protein
MHLENMCISWSTPFHSCLLTKAIESIVRIWYGSTSGRHSAPSFHPLHIFIGSLNFSTWVTSSTAQRGVTAASVNVVCLIRGCFFFISVAGKAWFFILIWPIVNDPFGCVEGYFSCSLRTLSEVPALFSVPNNLVRNALVLRQQSRVLKWNTFIKLLK